MKKVILYGCNGRMGLVLAELIKNSPDMEVVAGIDLHKIDKEFPTFTSLDQCSVDCDVMIDFSSPLSIEHYIPVAIEKQIPVVVATTGLQEKELTMLEKASHSIPIFRSANMSLGINLMQKLLQVSTKILEENYDIEIIEKHHHFKKDAPSGTALMLADSINKTLTKKKSYIYGRSGNDALRDAQTIGIHAVRGGSIVGEHEVLFAGKDEVISIEHKAYSRTVFATGAIAAAAFICGNTPKMYNMQDVIQSSSTDKQVSLSEGYSLLTAEIAQNDSKSLSTLYSLMSSYNTNIISQSMGERGHTHISLAISSIEVEGLIQEMNSLSRNIIRVDNLSKVVATRSSTKSLSEILASLSLHNIQLIALSNNEKEVSFFCEKQVSEHLVTILTKEL